MLNRLRRYFGLYVPRHTFTVGSVSAASILAAHGYAGFA